MKRLFVTGIAAFAMTAAAHAADLGVVCKGGVEVSNGKTLLDSAGNPIPCGAPAPAPAPVAIDTTGALFGLGIAAVGVGGLIAIGSSNNGNNNQYYFPPSPVSP